MTWRTLSNIRTSSFPSLWKWPNWCNLCVSASDPPPWNPLDRPDRHIIHSNQIHLSDRRQFCVSHNIVFFSFVLIWRPRCSDSDGGSSIRKSSAQLHCRINWAMTGHHTTRELGRCSGFTLKIDNEIVGLTKNRDHTHTLVCSQCLWSDKEGKLSERECSFVKSQAFFLSEKRKKYFALFFLSFQRKDSFLVSFLFYLISFLRSKVTYTGSTMSTLC